MKSITDIRGIWNTMKSRCFNPNATGYSAYGGRGITVCDRWKNSYKDFATDMGPRPSLDHSIDRKDNDGNYEPGNCRWATSEQQQMNRKYPKWRTTPLNQVNLKIREETREKLRKIAEHDRRSITNTVDVLADNRLKKILAVKGVTEPQTG